MAGERGVRRAHQHGVGAGTRSRGRRATIAARARELGLSTSMGIIHDPGGHLKPLSAEDRRIWEQVTRWATTAGGCSRTCTGSRDVRANLIDGRPNQWRCRAGARYLYICEDGLVHYCSQQRGLACDPARAIHGRRHPARVPDAEVVRTVLHDRLCPSGVDHGLLARSAAFLNWTSTSRLAPSPEGEVVGERRLGVAPQLCAAGMRAE